MRLAFFFNRVLGVEKYVPRGNYCVKSSRKGRAKNVVEPVWLSLATSRFWLLSSSGYTLWRLSNNIGLEKVDLCHRSRS